MISDLIQYSFLHSKVDMDRLDALSRLKNNAVQKESSSSGIDQGLGRVVVERKAACQGSSSVATHLEATGE
jgi:hypothetical protein